MRLTWMMDPEKFRRDGNVTEPDDDDDDVVEVPHPPSPSPLVSHTIGKGWTATRYKV